MAITFPNASFETGDATGWTFDAAVAVASGGSFSGTNSARFSGVGGNTSIIQSTVYPVYA